MNSLKLTSLLRAALCLAATLTFLPAPSVPQETQSTKVLKKVIPAYPEIIKKMSVSGTVRMQVTIAADGTVKDVEARGGNAIFIDSVAAAVRNWKFVPGQRQPPADISFSFMCCSTVVTNP